MSAKERLDELLIALDKKSRLPAAATPVAFPAGRSSVRRKLSPYEQHMEMIREGKKIAKEYCAKHPPVIRPPYTSATRSVGGEFSSPGFLKPREFKSEWDRERCKAPQRTYPSRQGAASDFYNPLDKSDWKPSQSRRALMDSVIEYTIEHVE